jgi:hypothetical protein
MEDAVKYMRENDYPLTMLYGIPNYYHKFGYIEAMGLYTAFLKVKTIEKLDAAHEVRSATPEDRDCLNDLYNEAYATKTGAMKREPAHWYKVFDLKKNIGSVALDKDGQIVGYALSTPPRAPQQYITEAVVPDSAVAASLLKHFATQAAARLESEIEIRVSPDHPLWQYAEVLGGRFTTRLYSEGEGEGMLGTINLLRTLEEIREELEARLTNSFFKGTNAALNIKTDTAGAATLIWDGAGLDVTAENDSSAPTLDIPQNLLTRSLVGYWDVDQLKLRAPEVLLSEGVESVLKVLFPLQHPFTCEADYF